MEPVFTINSWALTAIILFVTLSTGQANAVEYKKVGDEVVLSPGSEASPISSITWKHNSNLAAEWYGGEVEFYRDFKGRCKLNTATGELIIPNLTLKDSGSYKVEINNRVLKPTEIKVISGVSKPTVSENCDAEKTHCVLTCEGITTDSEPVTYTWWSGDVVKSETKQLIITKDDTEPSFTCELANPVSSERSREVTNPFTSSTSNTENNSNGLYRLFLSLGLDPGLGLGLGLGLVLVLVLAIAVVGFFIYRRRTGSFHSLPRYSPRVVETQTLLHDNNGEVQQSSSTLDHINETDKQGTNQQDQNNEESKPVELN
ncbi:CD48 antigen-like isoform X2 [Mugil cephalus]|uniref:CD48 antigen-like isoform X2 n=1 Tax=Mugil cephalus TaxID=48193 RepID=UPI001FB632CC|nr:CD48 antigen-like isoform X2 [Mugil cephalus]